MRITSTTSPKLTRRLSVAALTTLALLAAGCADRGSDEPATGAEAMRLNVGQTSDSVAFFPFFVAEQEGYFEDEGLTLGERPRLGTGAKLAAALQSGSIDVAGGVMTDVYNLYKINDEAKLVGTLTDEFYVDIVAGPGIDTGEDGKPLAEKVKALQGRKIGITGPGSGTEALLTYLLKQQGMDPKTDITMVNLGADASASIGALKAGRVDALSFFQPIGQQAEATGTGRLFISPAAGDIPAMQGQTHGTVFTTQSVIDRKGPAVQAFLRAIQKAEQLINGDTGKVTELFQEYQETMSPQAVQDLVTILQDEIPDDPTPDPEGYQKAATFHQESGLIEEPPGYADLVPESFITQGLNAAS